jgi:hypothetical protein
MPQKVILEKRQMNDTQLVDEWMTRLASEEIGLLDLVFFDELISQIPSNGKTGSSE